MVDLELRASGNDSQPFGLLFVALLHALQRGENELTALSTHSGLDLVDTVNA